MWWRSKVAGYSMQSWKYLITKVAETIQPHPVFNNVTWPEQERRATGGQVVCSSCQAHFQAFSANNTQSINFSIAPLLAGQVDNDISSLLETAETRCSNKIDLSGKSERPQRKEKAEKQPCCPRIGTVTHNSRLCWLKNYLRFFTGQLKDEL